MSHDPPVSRRPKRSAIPHRSSVMRLDGVRNWAKTLDHFVWFLMRAGIKPAYSGHERPSFRLMPDQDSG